MFGCSKHRNTNIPASYFSCFGGCPTSYFDVWSYNKLSIPTSIMNNLKNIYRVKTPINNHK